MSDPSCTFANCAENPWQLVWKLVSHRWLELNPCPLTPTISPLGQNEPALNDLVTDHHRPSMFPVCRMLKCLHGPHSTCLMTAETYLARFRHRHPRWLRTFFFSGCCCSLFTRHAESTIFLGSYILTAAFFLVFAVCSSLGYIGVRLCLRFQLKLALYLIMMRRVPFEFKLLNKVFLCCLHLLMFLTGGFGLLTLSFIDTWAWWIICRCICDD